MEVLVTGHKNPDSDSIISAIAAADLYRKRGFNTVPMSQGRPTPETVFILETFGLQPPAVIEDVREKELFLVDFSDIAQAPAGISDAVIKGIVDHHKLGDITTNAPLEAWIQPVGCTATIIKNMYDYYNIQIPRQIAGGLLCAILSDTVIFKSPTCTELDKNAVSELAKIAQVDDPVKLGMDMFKIKSAVVDTPASELLFRDYKDFDMNGKKVGIGQVEVIELSQLDHIKEELLEEMKKLKKEDRHSVFLLLTDIMQEGSELLIVSDEPEVVEKAFNIKTDKKKVWLPGVMSRKKQVVPNLQEAFK